MTSFLGNYSYARLQLHFSYHALECLGSLFTYLYRILSLFCRIVIIRKKWVRPQKLSVERSLKRRTRKAIRFINMSPMD